MRSQYCNDIKTWFKRHFLLGDFLFSVLFVLVVALCVIKIPQIKQLAELDCKARGDLYSFASAASVALLGFSITGITILLTLESRDNKRLVLLRKSKYYKQVYDVFIHAIYVHSLTLILSLTALVFDRSSTGIIGILYVLVIWAIILSAVRVWRCIWVLEEIIKLMTQNDSCIHSNVD